jgi:hypothetical protein
MTPVDTPPGAALAAPAARARLAGRVAALLLCGLHAWVARHVMNPDGISYLDMADAYARGDLGNALNSYWSPLYSWALGAALAVVRPAPYWECAVVHAVNFVVFLGALAAFEWFLAELVRAHRAAPDGARGTLPEWALVGLAYALFVWASRRLITVSYVTPDMCVAALVYLAAALLLRARRAGPARAPSALLGAVLGAAYLAKAVMFPLGFAFLAALGLAAGRPRRAAKHVALAGLCFLVVAGSFIVPLSLAKGRLTFGDSGRLNYAWYVNGAPRFHWLGGKDGEPAHPPRQVFAAPAAYEFAAPVAGTYPLWYDPPYWYEGVRTALVPQDQLAAAARSAGVYLGLLFRELGCFTVAALALHLLAPAGASGTLGARLRAATAALARYAPVLLPALAAVGIYLLVGQVEGRLIGPFLVLLLAGALAAARAPGWAAPRVAGAALALAGLALAYNVCYDARNAARSLAAGEGPAAHPAAQVADYLQRRGLPAGHGVGCVGYTFDAYWARLGGYRVVGEVPLWESGKFWGADRSTQGRVLAALRRAGARAVVAGPLSDAPRGWARVPGTTYFVYEWAEDDQPDARPRYAAAP